MNNGTCSIEGCEKHAQCRTWCPMHYQRWRRFGDLNFAPPRRGNGKARRIGVEPCTIEGCDKLQKARGWCSPHWKRWKRYGSPTARRRGQVVDGKRICPHCKVDKALSDYTPNTGGRCRRCCADTSNEWRKRNPEKLPKTPTTDGVCDCCGGAFRANKRRCRYCSRKCFLAYKNRANWKHGARRRARMKNALVETFEYSVIFERDNWTCGICEKQIEANLAWPDPMSPSVDHIIPLARGGMHERINVQAAHLGCNLRKGVSVKP